MGILTNFKQIKNLFIFQILILRIGKNHKKNQKYFFHAHLSHKFEVRLRNSQNFLDVKISDIKVSPVELFSVIKREGKSDGKPQISNPECHSHKMITESVSEAFSV